MIEASDIFGCKVVRGFSDGETSYKNGDFIKKDDLLKFPIANINALSNCGNIEVFKLPSLELVADMAREYGYKIVPNEKRGRPLKDEEGETLNV